MNNNQIEGPTSIQNSRKKAWLNLKNTLLQSIKQLV